MTLDSCSSAFKTKADSLEAAIRNRRHFDNNTMLLAYAYYKQASCGDNNTVAPSALNFKAKAKWDAWHKLYGMPCIQADREYVVLITRLGC